jgi:signal transduction histidine kinase
MTERWRRLPAVAQDSIAAVAFAMVWFSAYAFLRGRGWIPRQPSTYELAGAVTVLTLALRRVTPWGVLLATVVVYPMVYNTELQTEFHLLPVLVAGYSATSTGRVSTPVAVAGSGVAVLGLAAPLTLLGQETPVFGALTDWSRVLFAVFATAAAVALGALVHDQRHTARMLEARNAELERLRQMEAGQVVAAERTRIARELHDVVAHHLTAVVVRAQAAERVAPTRPEVAVESVGWIASTTREALSAMRQTVRVLRDEAGGEPVALAPGPVLGDLHGIAARLRAVGLRVDLDLPDPLPELDHQAELAALRIAQEALTNTLRHAGGTRAAVSLRFSDGIVRLVVDDDGRMGGPGPRADPAARPDHTGGHGLVGMRERAASCGGHLDLGDSPLGGWRVHARLPAAASVTAAAGAAPRPP